MLLTDTPVQICPNEVVFSEAAPAVSRSLSEATDVWTILASYFGAVYGILQPILRTDSMGNVPFKASLSLNMLTMFHR